jgi:hypothetical protein
MPIIDQQPWQSFACHVDFEFTELTHGAALNKNQTGELSWLIWKIVDSQMTFTFKSHGDVSKAWDRAAAQMTPVRESPHTAVTLLLYNTYSRG